MNLEHKVSQEVKRIEDLVKRLTERVEFLEQTKERDAVLEDRYKYQRAEHEPTHGIRAGLPT